MVRPLSVRYFNAYGFVAIQVVLVLVIVPKKYSVSDNSVRRMSQIIELRHDPYTYSCLNKNFSRHTKIMG